jgi:arylsulfatase A-like enzyme
MVGKWHNGFDNTNDWKGKVEGGPYGCGFDYFFGIPHSLDMQPYLYMENNHVVQAPTQTTVRGKEATAGVYESNGWNDIQGAFWRSGKTAPDFKHAEVLGKFTTKAVSVINDHSKTNPGAPLFLYLAYAGPHTPWLPSDAFKGKSGAGLYGDFLMEIDHEIGKVIEALEETGLKGNTLIMLSSDNGPVWYPENAKKYQHRSVGPLRGMKKDAFEGGHRMPFIASWPRMIPEGSVCKETICLTDIMRTLASVIGEELPEGVGMDSYDILPLLLGKKKGPVRDITIHTSKVLAIRKGKYKYLDGKGSGGHSKDTVSPNAPPGQLYDLESDLGETENLYRQHPEMVKKLKALLKEYRR